MKTILKLGVLLGTAALVTGCGPGDRTRNLTREVETEVFEVRLLGSSPGDLSAAVLSVADITATTPSRMLYVEPVLDTVDLTATHQAWLVGQLRVPEGVAAVDLSVQFDDAGGYESRLGNGMVDSRQAVVSWHAPVAWLRTNGHVVIDLDLQRSLVAIGGETRRLIPAATIRY
jgi:hypothetical protein